MHFLPFDLEHHLKAYNFMNDAHLGPQDIQFLQALSPESLHALTLANTLLKKSAQLGDQPLEGAQASFLDNIKTQLNDNDYQGVRFSLYKLSEFVQQNGIHTWYIEQHRRLSNPDLWDQITTNSTGHHSKKLLHVLKNQWLSGEAQYSAHTLSALWFVAKNIAEFYENYYRFATLELRTHRSKVPASIRTAYEEYLATAQNNLATFRTELCQAMLMRLQLAGASGNITYNDHIHYTAQWLSMNHLITHQRGLPSSQRNDLTPEYFQNLIGYINRYGSDIQKSAAMNLSFFISDDDYCVWHNHNSIILSPRTFYERKLIPQSAPWFPRLFTNRHFRYQFMEKNVWLLACLRSLPQYPLADNSIVSAIAHFREIEARLFEAAREIESKNDFSGIYRYLHYKTVLFCHEWSHYHQTAQIALLKKKIELIHTIHVELTKRKSVLLDSSLVHELIDEVSGSPLLMQASQEACERFYLAKASLMNIHTSQPIAAGTAPNINDQPITQSVTSTNPFDTPALVVSHLDNSVIDLLKNIKLIELDQVNFEEMLITLKHSMKTIVESGTPSEKKHLKTATESLFTHYLKKCASFSSFSEYEKYHDKCMSVEQLLLNFSPEHIKIRVQSITALRQQANYWFVFQLKCRSYLASFSPKIAHHLVTHSAIINTPQPIKHLEPLVIQETLTQ